MFKKKKSSGAKSSFNAQEFLIQHVEKIIFSVVAFLALGLVYMGVSTPTYPANKTPEEMKRQVSQVSTSLKENHWPEMLKQDPKRELKPKFFDGVREGREPIAPEPRTLGIVESLDGSGVRRADPALIAPTKLEVKYYYGPIAGTSDKPDPLEKLEDAKKPEDKPKPPPKNSGPGGPGRAPPGYPGSSGPPPGMGPAGMGGMAGGFGAGDPNKRILSPGYDHGFQFGMRTQTDSGASTPTDSAAEAKKIRVARTGGFVAVTALAPHEELEESYKKAFAGAEGYMEGRDHPVYQGFEVQRVEIVDPSKEIAEADWKPLPRSGTEEFKEGAKKWVGSCSEVHPDTWTDNNLSMPIPPMLLNDYKKYARHSEIPTSLKNEAETETEPASESSGGYGGLLGGYGGGGPPAGYGGGTGGAPPGYPGAASGPPAGYGGGTGGAPPGYPGAASGPPSNYGGFGGLSAPAAPSADAPKKLPSTKYKLVRFFDSSAVPGKVYKYRVRLVMYDPNFPEYASIQPRPSTLNKEAMTRIQPLLVKEPKEEGSETSGTTVKRKSHRESDWSKPSDPIAILKPALVYTSEVTSSMAPGASGEYFENSPSVAKSVFAELNKDKELSVYIPIMNQIERGSIFAKKKGNAEIIHPITKVIKVLKEKDAKLSSIIAVVDIKGVTPLKMGSASKDPIRTGGEVVSFDAQTGQLVISREFDDYTGFHMHTQPDQPAHGPLDGGLKAAAGAMPGGGSPMGGAPMGGAGKPGASGPGASSGSGTEAN